MDHLAMESFSDQELVHAPKIPAEYLDNNWDGMLDDLASGAAPERRHAVIILTNNAAKRNAIHRLSAQQPDLKPLDYITVTQGQYTDETNAAKTLCGRPCGTQFDASDEEALHLLQRTGYAEKLDTQRPTLVKPHCRGHQRDAHGM